jgi:HEAT repeat protein
MNEMVDVYDLRQLDVIERFNRCEEILRNEKDESLRWDAVWLAGESAEMEGKKSPIFDKVADLMAWVLQNDDNSVVKHEACYQIAMRKMYKKIPDLVNSAIYDNSSLVQHEAIEALGLLDAFDSKELVSKSLRSSNVDVRQTAEFVLRRLKRIKNIPTLHA